MVNIGDQEKDSKTVTNLKKLLKIKDQTKKGRKQNKNNKSKYTILEKP